MDVVYTNFKNSAEFQSLPPLSGRYARILVDGMEKEVPLSIIVFRYAPGQKGPIHSHKTETETYITLEGEGTVDVDGRVYHVVPESVLCILPGVTHQPSNLKKDEEWIFIAVFTPPMDLGELKRWFCIPTGEDFKFSS